MEHPFTHRQAVIFFFWYGSQSKNSIQLSLWEKQLLCVLSLCMLCMIQLWNDGIVKPQEQITSWGKKCQFLSGMFAPSVPLNIYLLSSCSIFLLVSARAHTYACRLKQWTEQAIWEKNWFTYVLLYTDMYRDDARKLLCTTNVKKTLQLHNAFE